MNYLQTVEMSKQNEQLISLVLKTLHILLENCPNAMNESLNKISEVKF
jgi:hypothetical protein